MPSVTLHQLHPATYAAPAPAPVEQVREITERLAPMQLLRRTGQRPHAFNGQLLATVCGVEQALPFWYEINVYRTVLGGYVSDVRLFGKGVDAADLFRVVEHDDVDQLTAYLERYDPSADLPPIRYDEQASAAALTLRAIEVRAEMRRIEDHYRVTVGALLDALSA